MWVNLRLLKPVDLLNTVRALTWEKYDINVRISVLMLTVIIFCISFGLVSDAHESAL